ncbi:uncharacterized protein LOC116843075 [Odontomachus brunneus]|uniref:uncharacterized protein LOC116843075 n=1 Tax=Odontomachus brunneus TaxID=486640 RepID=UPI0013F1A302|nr:uncharacterized protein LOC116843075 [Odontomachus brunneus]
MVNIYRVNRNLRLQASVDYNQFFHPNICHVCKSTDQVNLTPCSCYMISYCSEEHRLAHLSSHFDICKLISCIISQYSYWNASHLTDEWMKIQHDFILKIQAVLTRKLEPYEKQMFMFANSCFICHRRDVFTCGICFSFSYCAEHATIHEHQGYNCYQMALSVNMDIIFLDQTAYKSLHAKFYTFLDNNSLTDMYSFCNRYYRKWNRDQTQGFNFYAFTDYVSDPLTLYDGLRSARLFHSLQLMRTFIIHIIAANYVDRRNFPAWELFLHLLYRKTELVIIMIGPELEFEIDEYKLCSRCQALKKRLILRSFPLLYHNYVFSSSYRRPNVIIGFQAELYRVVTWSESIKAMQMQNCPLLLTGVSTYKLQMDINAIQHNLDRSVKPILQIKNGFASNRPYRDFNESILFRNMHLTIYKNLNVGSN